MWRERELYPLFATPCFGGLATWQFTRSMVDLGETFGKAGIPFKTWMLSDSVVDRARNDCVAEFFEQGCSDLFYIDADIAFQPQDALDMLTAGLDFVLGPYRKKCAEEKWTAALLEETQRTGKVAMRHHPGSRSIRYVAHAEGGAGFMCLSRAAVEQLVAGVPTYQGEREGEPRKTRTPDVFKSVISVEDDTRIGEDQYVCRRWRALGGTVWCSVDTRLKHIGSGSDVYEGDYARFIDLHVREAA